MVAGDRRLAGGDHLHIYKHTEHRGTGLGARCARRVINVLSKVVSTNF